MLEVKLLYVLEVSKCCEVMKTNFSINFTVCWHLNNIQMENWNKKTKIGGISLMTFVFTVLPQKNVLIWTEFLVLKNQFF